MSINFNVITAFPAQAFDKNETEKAEYEEMMTCLMRIKQLLYSLLLRI